MNRITVEQVQSSERFYRIPKLLVESKYYRKLSAEAKFCYAILKDRFDLSLKNDWVDEQGCVYLIFTVEELQELLGYGNKKVIKLKKELAKYGLLEEVRQGLNKPNLLYLGNIITDPRMLRQDFNEADETVTEEAKPLPEAEVSKRHFQKCQNDTSRNVNSTRQEVSKRHSNDTEYKETDNSETNYLEEDEEKAGRNLKKKVQQPSQFDKDYIYVLVESKLKTEIKSQATIDYYLGRFEDRYQLALNNMVYIKDSESVAEYVFNGLLSEISKELRRNAS
ncbi:replication initiator protein A [Streptococcus suis]|uniref:Replication initiator protein A n=1 Tax=Streptococcus suis TaxID=1307 RepID=A0A426G821_STRSU|nr:replication initiator protein A [Streptococcus suis]RRN51154.1 replication initiator protein A [Streptococcus suis]